MDAFFLVVGIFTFFYLIFRVLSHSSSDNSSKNVGNVGVSLEVFISEQLKNNPKKLLFGKTISRSGIGSRLSTFPREEILQTSIQMEQSSLSNRTKTEEFQVIRLIQIDGQVNRAHLYLKSTRDNSQIDIPYCFNVNLVAGDKIRIRFDVSPSESSHLSDEGTVLHSYRATITSNKYFFLTEGSSYDSPYYDYMIVADSGEIV